MNELSVIRRWLVLLAVALVALAVIPAPARAQDMGHLERLLAFVNEAREAARVSPVQMDSRLNSAAQRHSADMAGGDFLSHIGSDGSTFEQRIADTGYRLGTGAENVLFQLELEASKAFYYFWNSPEHRASIIDARFTQVGFGYARSASGKYYYTMLLAAPAIGGTIRPPLEGNVAPLASTDPIPVPPGSDGRLNEAGIPPIVVYCAQGGGVTIYKVDLATSQGTQVIFASLADIGGGLAQVASTGQNALIASAGDVSLWALANNELQAASGPVYRFTFRADRCGTPSVALAAAAAPVAMVETIPPPAMADFTGGTHVVRPGETLFRIALRYGLTTSQLAVANGISNPNRIFAGQVLVIPGLAAGAAAPGTSGLTHVVQPGETLFRIAVRYGTTVSALAAANGISNPSLIFAGQVLVIPDETAFG